MTDRRLHPSNGRVAHTSLRGRIEAARFVDGETRRICRTVAPLLDSVEPGTWRRERELVLHERFCVLEDGPDWAFGFAERDGYVGYVRRDALAPDLWTDTHVVAARQSYLVETPELKNSAEITPISFGTAFHVFATHDDGQWAEVSVLRGPEDVDGHKRDWTEYVPMAHLRPVTTPETDPVAVAERFLGTPYHWGGNSGFGIDCSGLVQAALLACAIACPGDSDQQMDLGDEIDGDLRRGDLVFWTGHVAIVVDAARLIHANAHHMAVAYEGIAEATARIAAAGDGPAIARRRVR